MAYNVTIRGTANFAFPAAGLPEDNNVVLTVANTAINTAGFQGITFNRLTSADHDSLDDYQWDGLFFNIENIIDGVSFDLRATARDFTWGTYTVNYSIIT